MGGSKEIKWEGMLPASVFSLRSGLVGDEWGRISEK